MTLEYVAVALCVLLILMAIMDALKWLLKPKRKKKWVAPNSHEDIEALRTKLYGKSR